MFSGFMQRGVNYFSSILNFGITPPMHKVHKPFSSFFGGVCLFFGASALSPSELQGFDSVRNDSSLGLNDRTGQQGCTDIAALRRGANALIQHARICQNVPLDRICIPLSYCKHPVQPSVASGCLSDHPLIRNDSFPISCRNIYHHHILLSPFSAS